MKRNIPVAAIGFLVMLVLMWLQGAILNTPVSPRGIVDLEFASTAERVRELLSHWDMPVVKINIWLDFLFIAAYVWFFFVITEASAMNWPEPHAMRNAGLFISKGAFAAGVFDAVENLLMLQTISGSYTPHSLQLTFYCAVFKFMIIAVAGVYCLASLPAAFKK